MTALLAFSYVKGGKSELVSYSGFSPFPCYGAAYFANSYG